MYKDRQHCRVELIQTFLTNDHCLSYKALMFTFMCKILFSCLKKAIVVLGYEYSNVTFLSSEQTVHVFNSLFLSFMIISIACYFGTLLIFCCVS